jgi:hypothetical protein
MALPGTGFDVDLLSAYLQSCLREQTKERQAQLDVLQKLTELKLGETFNEPSMVNGSPIEIPRVGTGVPSKLLGSEARGLQPAKVEIPSNFFPLPQSLKETVDQSQKLQHATQVLQAALANWEACVQGLDSSAAAPVLAPSAAKPVVQPQKPILEINSRLGHQAEEAAKPAGVLTSLLEKAIHNLNDTLPPDAAVIAQALLEGVATEAAPSMSCEVQEKRKWLQHVLENQNAASVQRLSHLLKEPAVPPFAPGWDAAAGLLGAASAASLQGATSGIGRSPIMSPYSALDSNSLLSGPGTPVGNWWQDNARHGFAAVAAQAQAQVQAQQAQQQQREMLQRQALLYMLQQSQTTTAAPQQRLPHPVGSVSASKDMAALRKGGGPKRRVTTAPSVEPPEAHHGETLRMHLRSLLAVDSNRVLIVRKINRLGFSSPTILKEHYSWYGTVENVLVAHSRVKSGSGQAGIVSRLRPSGLGFIVMSKMEEADAILKQGSEQHVCGALIRVQKFERRMSEMEEEDDDEEAGDVSIEGSNEERPKDLCKEEVAERMLKGA